MPYRLHARLFAAAAFALLISGAAHAFTIEGGPGAGGLSTNWKDLDVPKAKAVDPDSRFKSDNGGMEFKSGSGTFYFGPQRSFDQRYDTNNIFDPYARDGR
jgi:hypothetical protein